MSSGMFSKHNDSGMTDQEKSEFRLFCIMASNKQLIAIIVDECESACGGNIFRRDGLEIALDEAKSRGISV